MDNKQGFLLNYRSIRITYLFLLFILLIENHNIFYCFNLFLYEKRYVHIASFALIIINITLVLTLLFKKIFAVEGKLLLYFIISNFIIAFSYVINLSAYSFFAYCIIYSMICLAIFTYVKKHITEIKWLILYVLFIIISVLTFIQSLSSHIFISMQYDNSSFIQYTVFPILRVILFILLINFIFLKTKNELNKLNTPYKSL